MRLCALSIGISSDDLGLDLFFCSLGDTGKTGDAGAESLNDAGNLGAVAFVDEAGAESLGDAGDPGAVVFVDDAFAGSAEVLWMMLEKVLGWVLVDLREVVCLAFEDPLSFSFVLFPSSPRRLVSGRNSVPFFLLPWLVDWGWLYQWFGLLEGRILQCGQTVCNSSRSSALYYYHHLHIPAYSCLRGSLKALPCQADPKYIIFKGGTGGRS